MRLFKHDWEHYFNQMTAARDAVYNHEKFDAYKKRLLNKWERVIRKAEDYITLLETKDGTTDKLEAMRKVVADHKDKHASALVYGTWNEIQRQKAAKEKHVQKVRR